MWDMKPKATNEQTRKTNKQNFIDMDNSMVVTRGKKWLGEVVKGEGGQIYGNRKRFDFEW